MRFRLIVDGEARELEVEPAPRGFKVLVDGIAYRPQVRVAREGLEVRIGSRRFEIRFDGPRVQVDDAIHSVTIGDVRTEPPHRRRPGEGRAATIVDVRPSMPGRVVRVVVAAGDRVRRGQTLVVLEAMKMQNEIPAPGDGRVQEVGVVEGESVTPDRVVAVLAME